MILRSQSRLGDANESPDRVFFMKCTYCGFPFSTSLAEHCFSRLATRFAHVQTPFLGKLLKTLQSTQYSLSVSSEGHLYPFLLFFTTISRKSCHTHLHSPNRSQICFLLPFRHFSFSCSPGHPPSTQPYAAQPVLLAGIYPAIWQNRPSLPPRLLHSLFSVSPHRVSYFSSLLALTSAPSSSLSTLSQSSHTQYITTRSCPSCHLPTRICPVLPPISTLAKQSSSIPFILFAYRSSKTPSRTRFNSYHSVLKYLLLPVAAQFRHTVHHLLAG